MRTNQFWNGWQQVTFNRKYGNNIHPLIVAVNTKLYTKETENADLIFCDPPYYKKIREEYGPQSISSLSREEYLQVFQRAADAFARKAIKKVALLISNYDDEWWISRSSTRKIFIHHYINHFENCKISSDIIKKKFS